MRRTLAVFRGAKGYGWYNQYKTNPESFEKLTRPTPFNWDAPTPAGLGVALPIGHDIIHGPLPKHQTYYGKFRSIPREGQAPIRPRVFFEINMGKEELGRIEFEIASDILPRTGENFCLLAEGHKGKTYLNTKFHLIRKGVAVAGGDVEKNDGSSSHSAYDFRYFPDENFIIPHSGRGLLSMANAGVNGNGSQFFISFGENLHMNGISPVFGRVIKGIEVLDKIEKAFLVRGKPSEDIVITKSGAIPAESL